MGNCSVTGDEAVLFDPMNQEIGKATVQKIDEKQSRVYLQLEPGETIVLQWYLNEIDIESYPVWNISDEKTALNGESHYRSGQAWREL